MEHSDKFFSVVLFAIVFVNGILCNPDDPAQASSLSSTELAARGYEKTVGEDGQFVYTMKTEGHGGGSEGSGGGTAYQIQGGGGQGGSYQIGGSGDGTAKVGNLLSQVHTQVGKLLSYPGHLLTDPTITPFVGPPIHLNRGGSGYPRPHIDNLLPVHGGNVPQVEPFIGTVIPQGGQNVPPGSGEVLTKIGKPLSYPDHLLTGGNVIAVDPTIIPFVGPPIHLNRGGSGYPHPHFNSAMLVPGGNDPTITPFVGPPIHLNRGGPVPPVEPFIGTVMQQGRQNGQGSGGNGRQIFQGSGGGQVIHYLDASGNPITDVSGLLE